MTSGSEPLSPMSSVAEATQALDRSGETAAVVFEKGVPVGVITRVALLGLARHRPRPDARLADVMDFETVAIDPASNMAQTVETYTQAAWYSLGRRHPEADETVARRAHAFRPAGKRRAAPPTRA